MCKERLIPISVVVKDMAAGAGKSAVIGKSGASGSHASVTNSRKRKSDRNPTDELRLKDLLLRRLSSAAAVTRSFIQTSELFLLPSQSLSLESLVSSLPIGLSPSTSTSTSAAATWFHRFLTSAAEDDDPRWYHCFRMSRPTFYHLLSILSPSDDDCPSFPSSLAATIFRLAHGASYKSLVLRFGFDSPGDASRAFFTVCKLVNEKLGQFKDPKPDYLPRVLPNCCGVLGFGRFEVDGKLLGAKGSVLVQALVDSKGRFADISAGWPSTMNPEAIFRQTKLFSIAEDAESKSFLDGAPSILGNGISVSPYILGDSCFPLLPWLVTPYSNENEEEEEDSFRREFNNVLHTALHNVEIAFARVRAKWRILDRKWKPETIEFLPFVITTGCLLHNFLVNSGDVSQEEECVNVATVDRVEEDEETWRRPEREAYIGLSRIRNAIAENLSRVSSLS